VYSRSFAVRLCSLGAVIHAFDDRKQMTTSKPHDVEQWLTALGKPSADRDYKPGHARLLQLLSALTLQRPKLRIRVAGTNGKGSTSFMLAAALQACGLRVGLYTSPHILDFNERIRIDGIAVPNEQLMHSLAMLMPIALAAGASYFETATALALHQFSRANVDVEILEAGVGARLDATTAVDADMALITPIGLDHQNWLGDNLADIAREKAHIMNTCRHAISAPQCDEVAAILHAFNADLSFAEMHHAWDGLTAVGQHQHMNASLVWAAIKQLRPECDAVDLDLGLGLDLDLDLAHEAILQCHIPGRLQYLRLGEAHVWVDAAHNHHAIEALLPSLCSIADPFDAIVVATRHDRSLQAMLPALQPHAVRLVSLNDAISHSPALLLQQEIQQKPTGRFLVLGSFITVASILRMASD